MSKELIAKARELSAAATPGPWVYKAGDVLTEQGVMIAPDLYRGVPSLRDGKFIAESRTLLPALANLAESEGKRADAAEAGASFVARHRDDNARAQQDEFRRAEHAIYERNAALAELARLKGQVEIMRPAVEAVRNLRDSTGPSSLPGRAARAAFPYRPTIKGAAVKGAKELAEQARAMGHRAGFYFEVLPHLDRLAAIDSAVPGEVGEVGEIAARCEAGLAGDNILQAVRDIKVLLAIVQRQAGELNRVAETEKWLAKWKQVMAERVADQHEIERLQNVAEHARSEVDQLTERLRKLQHGEAEALKMMAAQKVALLAAETALDSSRAEVLRTMRDLPTEKQMADTITLGIVAYRRHWDLQFRETALAVIEWEDTHGHLVPR